KKEEESAPFVWTYELLDPEATAAKAYSLYPDGSCMYASFRSIVESVGKIRSEKNPSERAQWESFPYGMMFYGRGGIHDFGSICGVLNGCAAAISLLVHDRKAAAAMTRELFQYYESTELPLFQPANSSFKSVEQSTAKSVLCHISVSHWLDESDSEVESPRRKERCKRLTADGVKKAVQLLNQYDRSLAAKQPCTFAAPTESVAACIACHAPKVEREDANVRMDCVSCHEELTPDHAKHNEAASH
ncbi:MAG: C-GCAxxG-C-C family protein, partial [Thermoguttaceae bacterium]|nr:C-GCAxxG-C-C family protein [Thermoguttaceae bacterium]